MTIYKKTLKNLIVVCCAVLPLPTLAAQNSPILVEMFSSITCTSDPITQKEMQKIINDFPSVKFVNCRTGATVETLSESDQKDPFQIVFCDYKAASYFEKLHMFTMKSPLIIINGKYEAVTKDVATALKMAQSVDNIKNISISLKEKTLRIEIPDFESETGKGEIYIYTYAPTHEITINPEMPIPTDSAQDTLPKSEPFEGPAQPYTEFYLRPVVAVQKLAAWNGKEKNFSYPLPVSTTFKFEPKDLSYVIVLTSGEESSGDVLAVGELKSEAEMKADAGLSNSETKN